MDNIKTVIVFNYTSGYNIVCFSGLNSQGCEVFGCDTVYVQDSTENPCPTDFPISVQMINQYYYYVTTTASKIFIDGQVVRH